MKKVDILFLTFSSKGRDLGIVLPVLAYLEEYENIKWEVENIYLYPQAILKYNPRVVLFATMSGSYYLYKVSSHIKEIGIPIISLVTEGDYVEDKEAVNQMFWSFNVRKQYLPSLHILWTKRTVDLIRKYVEGSDNFNLKYSGAPGFDRYKFKKFMQKEKFLELYNKDQYKKIIGIGGFGFNPFGEIYYEQNKENVDKNYGEEYIEFHRKSRDLLKEIYKKLIINNEDILFILKHHPGSTLESDTEFFGIDKFDNVISIRTNEIDIADIINVSDIWIAYESTTCLEAWLLNKPTFLINPLGGDFKRSIIHKGSPIVKTFEEAQKYIDEYYYTGKISDFERLKEYRNNIIKHVIEFSDGYNHKRVARIISEFIKNMNSKKYNCFSYKCIKNYIISYIRYILYKLVKFNILKNLNIINNQFNNLYKFSKKEFYLFYKTYKEDIKRFHRENKL